MIGAKVTARGRVAVKVNISTGFSDADGGFAFSLGLFILCSLTGESRDVVHAFGTFLCAEVFCLSRSWNAKVKP